MSDVTGEGRPSTEATTDEPAASDQQEAHELPATEDQQGQESQPPEPVLDAATGGATDEGMEGPIEELPTAEPEPSEPVEAEGAGAAPDESPPPMLEDLAVAEAAGPGELVDSNGEQIAWQPVVDGDQLEWQPIVTSDPGNDDDQVSGIESDVQPDFEYPEETEVESWDAGVT
ncbi:MAG: hypothetical protein M3314_07650, partial [Actinomycetota bacterium]|nr:hypothetical protein [Actinomycetota bacterium]